ncbi:MAG: phosphatase PAP2 family protein [Clostridia bacterium]|nr:phosphatase PAP2 family protein [Clostridia bacterium]
MGYSYKKLYEKSAAFFEARPKAKKALSLFDKLLTGTFGLAYIGLWVYAVLWGNFSTHDFIRIAFIPLLTLFLVSVLRAMIARPRPYSTKGAGITPLTKRKGSEEDSFPSRHLACAAAIVLCFFPSLPIMGGGLLALAVILAWVRFALGLHYPSDLLAGGAVGSIVAGFYYLLEYVFALLS